MGNLYQVKNTMDYQGQHCLNVYNFEATGTGETSADLAAAFNTAFKTPVAALQNVGVSGWGVEVINYDNPADFFSSFDAAYIGGVSGEGLPPANCWTFKYSRATRAVRNGYKRIVGIPEVYQNGGYVVGSGVGLVAALAIVMETPLTFGSGEVWTPRIFRVTYPIPNPLHLTGTAIAFPIAGVNYEHIGTQNTRKF